MGCCGDQEGASSNGNPVCGRGDPDILLLNMTYWLRLADARSSLNDAIYMQRSTGDRRAYNAEGLKTPTPNSNF